MSACELIELPPKVVQAASVGWGVTVDAYLLNAARVGDRFTAQVYCDLSGISSNGMTVVTPEVRVVEQKGGYTLIRSLSGMDHYVIVSAMPDNADFLNGCDSSLFEPQST